MITITTPNKAFIIPFYLKEVGKRCLYQTSALLCFFQICRVKFPLCFLPLQANLQMCRMLWSKRAQLVMMGLQFEPPASEQSTTNPPGLLLGRTVSVARAQSRLGYFPHSYQGAAVTLSGWDLAQDAHTRYDLSRSTEHHYPVSSH